MFEYDRFNFTQMFTHRPQENLQLMGELFL
jgi:hypothetical protein